MIFATLGSQLPFDRFLKMLDEVVPSLFSEEIVAQAIPGDYTPRGGPPRGPPPPATSISRDLSLLPISKNICTGRA